jgi:hypothetical protein
MSVRISKIAPLIGFGILVAIVFVAGYYLWVMNFTLFNSVQFTGNAKELSLQDQQTIRNLVLNDNYFIHTSHKLLRFTVKVDRKSYTMNSANSAVYSGTVMPNNSMVGEGIISVTKQNGEWKIHYIATSS